MRAWYVKASGLQPAPCARAYQISAAAVSPFLAAASILGFQLRDTYTSSTRNTFRHEIGQRWFLPFVLSSMVLKVSTFGVMLPPRSAKSDAAMENPANTFQGSGSACFFWYCSIIGPQRCLKSMRGCQWNCHPKLKHTDTTKRTSCSSYQE